MRESLFGVGECQARALSIDDHSEGLLHPSSLESLPPLQLQDVIVPILGPMLVSSMLFSPKNHLGPSQISLSPWTGHHMYHMY